MDTEIEYTEHVYIWDKHPEIVWVVPHNKDNLLMNGYWCCIAEGDINISIVNMQYLLWEQTPENKDDPDFEEITLNQNVKELING